MFRHLASSLRYGRVASNIVGSVRNLNLHEYQSISLLRAHGAKVQTGSVAHSKDMALEVAHSILKSDPNADVIVKAQIHAGGRGKGTFTNGLKGGVQIVNSASKAATFAEKMIGNTLITKQTGEQGQLCQSVLINQGINIVDEKYFAILLDRAHNGPVMVGSHRGGMNIEEVAEESPGDIVSITIDVNKGMTQAQAEEMARRIHFTGDKVQKAARNMLALYDLFIKKDATQVEINPMATADDGEVYCVDAKLNFDDNAAFRQKDIFAMRDESMEDERDVKAEKVGLNYIALDGSIGCMVNGAGLAMATMDIIQLYGGKPANFLDVGGGATKDQVAEAFKILVSDPNVKSILVNIFGGIMKCDVIASGIIAAYEEIGLTIPLVVRLEGTNVSQGLELLEKSGLPIITARGLGEAADKAVKTISSTA